MLYGMAYLQTVDVAAAFELIRASIPDFDAQLVLTEPTLTDPLLEEVMATVSTFIADQSFRRRSGMYRTDSNTICHLYHV